MSNQRIQNSDVKGQAQVPTKADLIHDSKIYVTANSINKRLDEAITDGDIGAGGGEGGINYITNSNFEVDATGWTTYADAANAVPVDGVGGSPNVTFVRSTSAPLRGVASGLFTKDAANRQGQGVAVPFTIDPADQAQKLTIKFDRDGSSANYADGDMRLYIYDVTNAQIIRVNGEDIMAGNGVQYAQFQTAPNSTSYRLIFHVATTKETSYTLKIDNVSVGPTNLAFGTIDSDWELYTPTWTATTTNPSLGNGSIVGYWKKSGESLSCIIRLITGTTTTFGSGFYRFGIPSGLSINNTKLQSETATGTAGTVNWGGVNHIGFVALIAGVNSVQNVGIRQIDGGISAWSNTIPNAPTASTANQIMSLEFTVPIAGWSSNARMSEDLGGREVFLSLNASSQAVPDSTITTITSAANTDTTNSYSEGVWTCPETGIYQINAKALAQIPSGAFLDCGFSINLPSGLTDVTRQYNFSATNQFITTESNTTRRLIKGNQVRFVVRHNSGSTINLSSDGNYQDFTITKIPSPQTMLETETVGLYVRSTTGQTFPVLFTTDSINYNQIIDSTHSNYNTSNGQFTVPSSGWYSINASVCFQSIALTAGQTIVLRIERNNTEQVRSRDVFETSITRVVSLQCSTSFYANKGDTIRASVTNGSNTGLALDTNATFNTLSITRIK